ncbi:MAG: IS1380 family transposase [Labilithrix sp.]|nr:IS1380 family transposase [Labilithrix sp.]
MGKRDSSLSAFGGLASFNAFVQAEGIGQELREQFGYLKRGRRVVYPMHTQMQLLIDAALVGAKRVFDLEWLAGDPLFTHLAGGAVPSVDILYDDLRRFGPEDLENLEALVAEQGLEPVRAKRWRELTVDIDTTVTPVFGEQEGARLGSNPRYHARPSYHPILARIAETNTLLGARLRPGDTSLGGGDAEDLTQWLGRLREAAPKTTVTVRIDAGGDCAALMKAIDDAKDYFLVKAKLTPNLLSAVIWQTPSWDTVDRDALDRPTRQVAEIPFEREDWPQGKYRVFAVRTNERDSGRQVELWQDLDFSVHVYITNDWDRSADELARLYDDRAGIEPVIAELKNGFGIGKVSTSVFDANEAALLIKLLAYNLMRRWVATKVSADLSWQASWIRRTCICVPARLLRSGGRWELRLAPRPMLN